MKKFKSVAGLDAKHVLGQDMSNRFWLGTLTDLPPYTSIHFVPVKATMEADSEPRKRVS